MKLTFNDNIIKHYLQNVYFINGHSYAGKSTMVKMLSERFDMIFCKENYHDVFPREKLSRWKQPALCYFDTMSGWDEWLNMTPEQHYNWMQGVSEECTEIEILELIKLSASGKKVIVDTNISPEILWQISDYNHVAIMLCDPSDICSKLFFNREDPEKQFMLEQIKLCKAPEVTLANFNSWATYHPQNETDWNNTGFFTLTRSDFEKDTREETLQKLAGHFGLTTDRKDNVK